MPPEDYVVNCRWSELAVVNLAKLTPCGGIAARINGIYICGNPAAADRNRMAIAQGLPGTPCIYDSLYPCPQWQMAPGEPVKTK